MGNSISVSSKVQTFYLRFVFMACVLVCSMVPGFVSANLSHLLPNLFPTPSIFSMYLQKILHKKCPHKLLNFKIEMFNDQFSMYNVQVGPL